MSGTTRHRIAVVDDQSSQCRALRRLLLAAGLEVDAFAGGEAFLDSLSVHVPDCLILDLHMPGMAGLEVQARLAEIHRPIPVIVITGYDRPADRGKALAAGAVAFMRKPVSEELLLAAIRQAVGSPTGERAPSDGGRS